METPGAQSRERKRLGFVVNPVAGLGGRVGLKGSDGASTQREALARGAIPFAEERARRALERLAGLKGTIDLLTFASEMGETLARVRVRTARPRLDPARRDDRGGHEGRGAGDGTSGR